MTQHYEAAPMGFRPTFIPLAFWQCEPLFVAIPPKQVARAYGKWALDVAKNMMLLSRAWDDDRSVLMETALRMQNEGSSISKVVEEVSVTPQYQHEVRQILDRGWVSSVLDSREYVVKMLKEMPYEQYLQTVHWKYVRFSKIIVSGAKCRSVYCPNNKPMWDDLSNLHIHHETYVNRGGEAPEDLTPLCAACHALAHEPEDVRLEAQRRYLMTIEF